MDTLHAEPMEDGQELPHRERIAQIKTILDTRPRGMARFENVDPDRVPADKGAARKYRRLEAGNPRKQTGKAALPPFRGSSDQSPPQYYYNWPGCWRFAPFFTCCDGNFSPGYWPGHHTGKEKQ